MRNSALAELLQFVCAPIARRSVGQPLSNCCYALVANGALNPTMLTTIGRALLARPTASSSGLRKSAALPHFPRKRTSSYPVGMSQTRQERTHAPRQAVNLFDHFIGACERGGWTTRSSVFAVLRLITSLVRNRSVTGLASRSVWRRKLPTAYPARFRRQYSSVIEAGPGVDGSLASLRRD